MIQSKVKANDDVWILWVVKHKVKILNSG